MREIITLQLGQRANYLATHFWNLQESYFTYDEEESPVDHDVLFRTGTGADGSDTFTPRTLIYDLKGAFGTLRKYNALYQLSEDVNPGQGLWDGKEIIQQQPSIPQSDYQKNLDAGLPAPPLSSETVRYWSDYNRLFYHPRSILQLNDYELNSKVMPFEDWEMGEELFNNIDKEHDLLDRDVRPFAEECDQMRGLQVFTGSDDAWGGFTAKYVDRLRDEYGKKAMWVWAIEDGAQVDRQARNKRDINRARSLHSIAPQSSLYTPIIDPPSRLPGSIHLNHQSQWYTSALISCALESVTLPTRLRAYHDFESSLAGDDSSHNIFELQSTIIQNQDKYRQQHPATAGVSEDTDDPGSHSAEAQTKFDIDFTYDGFEGERPHVFNQLLVLRGIQSQEDGTPSYEDTGLLRKKRHYDSQPMFQSFHTPLKLPILDSFPQDMFREAPSDGKLGVLTGLTTSSRTAEKIKLMETVARRIISIDERETIINGLGEIRETYETGWMSGSDPDDE